MNKVSAVENVKNQKGAVAIFVGMLVFLVLIGVGALALDLNNLMVSRNELKNAADAGALAGTQALYVKVGDQAVVNLQSNAMAHATATLNNSQTNPVENILAEDVKRGHWSFGLGSLARGFYENENVTELPSSNGQSMQELDEDPNFVNAVWVRTKRERVAVASWLGKVFNQTEMQVSRESVAYIGPAGNLKRGAVDIPFAVCEQSIVNEEGEYSCNYGLAKNDNDDTGGWTNFTTPCETANANDVKGLVCNGDNDSEIKIGDSIGTTNGNMAVAFKKWLDCWDQRNPIHGTVPVVDCPGGKVGNCMEVVGSASLYVVWINDNKVSEKKFEGIPTEMAAIPEAGINSSYSCTDDSSTSAREACWEDFVEHYDLRDPQGNLLTDSSDNKGFIKDTVYFVPSCEFEDIDAGIGGNFYGTLSKIPVLVDRERMDSLRQ